MSGTDFYESNDPTECVRALNEVDVLRIGFNPTRSTSPCYNTTHACNNTYTKMNQTNPIQRTVRSVHVCALHRAQLLRTILLRTDLIIFPLTLQTITVAPMMSI